MGLFKEIYTKDEDQLNAERINVAEEKCKNNFDTFSTTIKDHILDKKDDITVLLNKIVEEGDSDDIILLLEAKEELKELENLLKKGEELKKDFFS